MTSFQERQKNLFKHLKNAEELCNFSKSTTSSSQPDYGTIDKNKYKKVKHEMKQFRGRESIFKRPEANIRECLRSKCTPDYIKNPEKWKYYSLSDVTPEQMSDKTNTKTALAFIREMEEKEIKKDENTVTDETGAVFKKPTFKISKTIKEKLIEDKEPPIFKNSKFIMPEYVVGITGKKINKTKEKSNKQGNSSEDMTKTKLKLNHLYENDDECV